MPPTTPPRRPAPTHPAPAGDAPAGRKPVVLEVSAKTVTLTRRNRLLALAQTDQGIAVVKRFAGRWVLLSYPAVTRESLDEAQSDLASHVAFDAETWRGQ